MPNLDTPTFPFTATGVYVQTAAPLQFGTIPVGATEVAPITISNFGVSGTVTIGTSFNDPSYTVLTTPQNTCQAGIAPGQSCTLPVQFNPSTVGPHNALLTLTPSAGPAPAAVGLNGTAAAIPQISGISPSYGAPAAVITITGSNLGATQGNGYVTVGGAISQVTSWSSTSITIRVPSRATTGNVVVTTAGGPSNGLPFTFYPFPTISGFSPASVAVGSPVTITGNGLLDGGSLARVSFNGIPATIVTDSSGGIQVNVPEGATTGPVAVHVNGVTIFSSTNFEVAGLPVPEISGISPGYGAPAAVINVSGTNFGATQSGGFVTIGGAPSEVIAWSNTGIMVRVPSRASTGNLVVTAGGGTSNGASFTFYSEPSITGLSVDSGPVGTSVTITGNNLVDGGNNATVTFGGIPATISSGTSGSIQVTVPTGATSGRLLVKVNGVSLIASTLFTVTP